MSQAAQTKPGQAKPGQGKPGQGGRGRGPSLYGRCPPGGIKDGRPKRPRREPEVEIWVQKTILGKQVDAGKITT